MSSTSATGTRARTKSDRDTRSAGLARRVTRRSEGDEDDTDMGIIPLSVTSRSPGKV